MIHKTMVKHNGGGATCSKVVPITDANEETETPRTVEINRPPEGPLINNFINEFINSRQNFNVQEGQAAKSQQAQSQIPDYIQAQKARQSNKTNALLTLPDLAIVKILSYLTNNVDDETEIKNIRTACTVLSTAATMPSMNENYEVITKKMILESFKNFLIGSSSLWRALAQSEKWISLQIFPIFKILKSEGNFTYIIFVLGMEYSPNDDKLSWTLTKGDNEPIATFIKNYDKLDIIDDVLTTFATKGAEYMFDNLAVNKNSILINATQAAASSAQELSVSNSIGYVLTVFDAARDAVQNANLQRQTEKSLSQAKINLDFITSIEKVKKTEGLRNLSQDRLQELQKNMAEKSSREKLAMLTYLANWFGNDDTKIVINQQCPLPGGKKKASYKFFEKRVVLGRSRNVYKLGNKLFVKSKDCYIGLREYIKMKVKK